jgi:hypothetical protein
VCKIANNKNYNLNKENFRRKKRIQNNQLLMNNQTNNNLLNYIINNNWNTSLIKFKNSQKNSQNNEVQMDKVVSFENLISTNYSPINFLEKSEANFLNNKNLMYREIKFQSLDKTTATKEWIVQILPANEMGKKYDVNFTFMNEISKCNLLNKTSLAPFQIFS